MEGRREFPVNPKALPENPLSNEDQVLHALEHQLSPEARKQLELIEDPAATFEMFYNAAADFNGLPPEDRGMGKYDHSRPLTENVDRTLVTKHAKGYVYTITLHKNGEITFTPALG